MKTTIIAVGKMKDAKQLALYNDYAARITPAPIIREIQQSTGAPAEMKAREAVAITKLIDPEAFLIVLDERGKHMGSQEFANQLQSAMNNGKSHMQIIIGGAEGLTDDIRARAHLLLAFGKLTWPHMLVRIMLLEQIYRAKQILAGHPYHREG
jgi:23S rRNA (pseudouridine1915-N3)-methyltransferase